MQIYWIENGTRCGPASVPDVLSKVQLGELSPETTRGWHAGCSEWLPLKDLPALADFLGDKLPEPPSSPAAPQDDTTPTEPEPAPAADAAPAVQVVALPGPMLRILARLVDLALYATVVLGIMYSLKVPYNIYIQPGSPLFWLPLPLLEGLMLSCWGTTPGKQWLGIRVQPLRQGSRLSRFVMRSMLVFMLGVGCMVPLLGLIMLVLSYMSLKRRGYAVWDAAAGTVPIMVRRPTSLSVVFVFVFLYLSCLVSSNYMLPWLPELLKEADKTMPSFSARVRELLPPEIAEPNKAKQVVPTGPLNPPPGAGSAH